MSADPSIADTTDQSTGASQRRRSDCRGVSALRRGFAAALDMGADAAIVQDLIPWVDKNLHTIADKDHRAIGGVSRGAAWALIHLLKAVEIDFAPVLQKKNALVSLRQIIRELEGTQAMVWSPMILNGTGFGLLANHSLVMASYISRANAAIIDLRDLLSRG